MLFQHSPPLFIKQIASNRIILLTKFRIIYSFIDRPLQSLYSILVEKNPLRLKYSFQKQESLVVTEKSIEIYSCDFVNEVVLKKVIILNEEIVYSILHTNSKEWQVFGEIYQYSTKNVQIHCIQPKSVQQQALCHCFIEQFEIYVGKNRSINIYDHKKQIGQELKWNASTTQIQTYLKNVQISKLSLKGYKLCFPKYKQKNTASTINECKSQCEQNLLRQSIKKSESPFSHKRYGSQFYPHSSTIQEASMRISSFFHQQSFVLVLKIDQKFVLVLIPPQKQYSEPYPSKGSVVMSLKSSGNNVQRQTFSSRLQKKWQMKNLNLFSTPFQIIYASIYRRFPNQSLIAAHEMIKTNFLPDKQVIEEMHQSQKLWTISQTSKGLIFSLIKLDYIQPINSQQEKQILVMDQNASKSLLIEHYLIPEKNLLTNNGQLNLEYEFVQFVLSFNKSKNDPSVNFKPVIELIEVDNKAKDNSVGLHFLYFDQLNKSKTLMQVKINAIKILDETSNNLFTSIKSTIPNSARNIEGKGIFNSIDENTSIKRSEKITINNLPVFAHNVNLNSSQSLSTISLISSSQPINLTYSNEKQLTKTLLSKIQSIQSQKSQTIDTDQQKPLTQSQYQKYKGLSLQSSPQSSANPLKQSRNRFGSPVKIAAETKQFMNSIQQVTEVRLSPSYRPAPNPINQVSEYHEQSYSKFNQEEQIESVEEVMEIVDFDKPPSSRNRSYGVAVSGNRSSKNRSEHSSVVERVSFDVENEQKMILVNKESFGIIKNDKKMIEQKLSHDNFLPKKVSSPRKFTSKHMLGLDHSLQNQTQEKQFYQKFINHFDSRNQDNNLSQTNLINLKESRESRNSIQKGFKTSKVSADEQTKKQSMQNMIGKDISEIVHGKHLELNTDEDGSDEEKTIELGEEIEKEYSRSEMRMGSMQNLEGKKQSAGQGLFMKHNASISYSEPTVILLDQINTSIEKQNIIRSQNYTAQQQMDLNHPDTPGFNFDLHHFQNEHIMKQPQIGIVSNDLWGNFSKKWNMTANQQYNEAEEFNVRDSRESFRSRGKGKESRSSVLVARKQYQKLSRKVKAFCIDPQKLTLEQVRQIQSKKYTQLMRQIFVRSQEQFNTLMRQFLLEIIQQEQARLFFAQYIRTFSGKTRDILVRLYMSLPDTEENKMYMSRALSEFKLSQVPEICLPIQKDVLAIFKLLYPSVFVEDLLKPSIPLYQKLLENYFSLQKLPFDSLTIEDQAIDLTHPRNMLNILLYLNELYNLPMAQLFEVYCTELIKHDCSQVIVKMLREEQTFEICQVNKGILQDIVENTIVQKLKENSANIQWIGKSLDILDCGISSTALNKKAYLSVLLNVIDTLNLSDCSFNIDTLFKLPDIKNLFVFCNTLIRQNDTRNLKKLNFPQLYKDLHEIAYEQKLKYYNQQLKDLMEILCEKYFQSQSYSMAFSIIAPMVAMIKKGFIAKMLFKYMEGKLMNRLANKTFSNKNEFMSTFKQFFGNVTQSQRLVKQPIIQHDKFQFDSSKSYLMNCPYFKFYGMYSDCVSSTQCEQVIFICYTDYQLASELASYHVLNKKEWQDLSQALNSYVPKEEIKKLVAKSVFKFNSRVVIGDQKDEQAQAEPKCERTTSFMMKDSMLLNVDRSKEESKHIKSLQAIDFEVGNKKEHATKKLTVYRSKSDAKVPEQPQKSNNNKTPDDSIIQSLKYQVNPESIKSTLKQIYHKKSPTSSKDFLKALSIIDRQRFGLCHYEKYKTIINLQLDFQVEKLLPFEFFFSSDYEQCFELITQNGLRKKLSLKNFWTVYILMEILLSKGEDVAVLMIEKLLTENRGDGIDNVIGQILDKCKMGQKNLKLLEVRAEMEGEIDIAKKLKQRILQNIK